ncbi:MAG: hypothetical protein PHW84_01925 [Methanosarcina sp.]|nr:hypothetical protein [Methanosarcina sp.]
MNETPYGQPKAPVTITKVKSDRFLDITNLHTWILFVAIGCGMYLFRSFALAGNNADRLMYAVWFVLVVVLWVKYFRNDELVEFQKDRFLFFIADKRGKHTIDAYAEQLKTLKKIIPIDAIHENGIIEFDMNESGFLHWLKRLLKLEIRRNNEYGVLMETFPPRISDEFREFHEAKQEKVVNGLPVNTFYESIACSIQEPKKPALKYLLELQQTSGGKACDQLLSEMYLKISQDKDQVISWRYFAFISLGEQKNIEAARIQFGAVIPGQLRSMANASLHPVVLKDEQSIVNAYKMMLGEVSI